MSTLTANGADKRLVLHLRFRYGSLLITTPVSLLTNELDVHLAEKEKESWLLYFNCIAEEERELVSLL